MSGASLLLSSSHQFIPFSLGPLLLRRPSSSLSFIHKIIENDQLVSATDFPQQRPLHHTERPISLFLPSPEALAAQELRTATVTSGVTTHTAPPRARRIGCQRTERTKRGRWSWRIFYGRTGRNKSVFSRG